jgi:hypothetical protein
MRSPGCGCSLEAMTARQIDEAATKLRDLRALTIGDLALAGIVFALAITASLISPSLALPLLIGALAVTVLGVRALLQHEFLVEDLALDEDAYEIGDVRRYGARVASPEHRRALAGSLRAALHGAGPQPDLTELIAALEDEQRVVDPCGVVSLEQSLLAAAPVDELRSRLRALLEGSDR